MAARNTHAHFLGKERAESDQAMLNSAFIETPEYKSLVAGADNYLVIGRRGAGKSALFYKIRQHWAAARGTLLLAITPSELDIVGLKALACRFGTSYGIVRAASKLSWQVAVFLSLAEALRGNYKSRRVPLDPAIAELTNLWAADTGNSPTGRIFGLLKWALDDIDPKSDTALTEVSQVLKTRQLRRTVEGALESSGLRAVVLFDKLDEGWIPDVPSTAFVAGLASLASDLSSEDSHMRTTVFVRDNIYRAMARWDPDHERNLEGAALRLYWDEHSLLNLVAARIRNSLGLEIESAAKIWRRATARDIQGPDGFRRCLKLTLYRPRDILLLLNRAFLTAAREGRDRIVDDDINSAGHGISESRLSDLQKEYKVVIPGLDKLIDAFRGTSGCYEKSEVLRIIETAIADSDLTEDEAQHAAVMRTGGLMQQLYSIGFLGYSQGDAYRFCHDGSAVEEAASAEELIVHPCYRLALNLQSDAPGRMVEIFDEHDIDVVSEQIEVRAKEVGRVLSELHKIEPGPEQAAAFEEWCMRALQIVCAGHLINFERHPNSDAIQRRDITARIVAEQGFWKQVRDDYGVRQAVFETKNYEDPEYHDFRQLHGYLSNQYGRLGFIVTRGACVDLPDKVQGWVKEIWDSHQRLCIVLTQKTLERMISKSREPAKHDSIQDRFLKLLDQYERDYLSLRHRVTRRTRRKSQKK